MKLRSYFVSSALLIVTGISAYATPLDDYVKKQDPSYSWRVEKTIQNEGYTTFIIDLKSQTWRASPEVNRPLWQHWLIVVRPTRLKKNKVLLYVGNGKSEETVPQNADPKWVEIAKNTNSIVAELRNVPNQPLVYMEDAQERFEDNSVAYTWDKFMTTLDPTWSIRLPMVKSVVKAMDTLDDLFKSTQGGNIRIDGYVVAGASKRGWATWLAAAVDQRVIGIIPMVIDVLNVKKFLKHHYEAYGFWAPAIKDYVNHNILQRIDTPAFSKLMELEDPYSYRNRITVPKYMINASGDQFFLPDSSQFYYNKLVGQKYIRYLPNANHSMAESDAFQCLESFYSSLIYESALPQFSWEKASDGSLIVRTTEKPQKVLLWHATNPDARDFRTETIGKAFVSIPLHPREDGSYRGYFPPPIRGYSAFFVELTYARHDSAPLQFTTEVSVLPDRLPFKK